MPEKERFSGTLHLMSAVVTRYTVSLLCTRGIDPQRRSFFPDVYGFGGENECKPFEKLMIMCIMLSIRLYNLVETRQFFTFSKFVLYHNGSKINGGL